MVDRRPLTEGLKTAPAAVPNAREREFVFGKSTSAEPAPVNTAPANTSSSIPSTPISTRMRTDFAIALKRASLDRQLKGQEPNTIREILEQAIEPWLKSNGYIS